MPTYQYRCRECDEDLEVVQSFSDDPLTKCPNCKKKALRKVFAAPGIAFKGSGFYKNDSRSSAKSASSSSTGTGSSSEKPDTKSDTKSESTAEKKSEPKPDKAAPAKASSAKD